MPLPLDVVAGIYSRNPKVKLESAEPVADARLPKGWSRELNGSGNSWTARATAPDGREIVKSGRTAAGALVALAKALGQPEAARKPITRRTMRPTQAPLWPYPSDVDAFLDLVAPDAPDDDTQRRDVARFLARHHMSAASLPSELHDALRQRRLLPGQEWPQSEPERRDVEAPPW